jgi:esterase/lipase
MSLIIEPDIEKTRLIVSFAGRDTRLGTIHKYDFLNFLEAHFPQTSRHFHMDRQNDMYHSGIRGETSGVDDTVRYLSEKIRGYRHVVFVGVSSGGYAALLYGSLLGVPAVLAFIPQTRLYRSGSDMRYRDLLPVINPTTRYMVVGDTTVETDPFHHISHCDHIAIHPNVEVIRKDGMCLRTMRSNGELLRLLRSATIIP